MKKIKKIELLAPAKNLACGKAAITHGADAVYIGAPRFGARSAAGNSLEEIKELVIFAHRFGAKIYVTLNTILKDEELVDARALAWDLSRVGIDALIVQDMSLIQMDDMPPLALHASTQMDNRTPEQVDFLSKAGIEQSVLARELSLDEIRKIHETVPEMALEVFIHGSLCVSYSGKCYASQCLLGRSANRGECAQICRYPYDLVDADNELIISDKHLLSMKDMNRINQLEALLDAGATSLKIEGRLKDVSYVKNVVSAYRQALDDLFEKRPEYIASSSGFVTHHFVPQLDKSFSRGFTEYYLKGRTEDVSNPDTPKSYGEEMGRFKEVRGNYLTMSGVKTFNNGDGACFINVNGEMQGFRVNRVEENRLFPLHMPKIPRRAILYRNYDNEFERLLSSDHSAIRTIPVTMELLEVTDGFALKVEDQDGITATGTIVWEHQLARSPQKEQFIRQLIKLGDTDFCVSEPKVDITITISDTWFIPASKLADLRRQVMDKLVENRLAHFVPKEKKYEATTHAYTSENLDYRANISNHEAEAFYKQHGVKTIEPAYELAPVEEAILMETKHCLRYAMGWCPTYQHEKNPYKEPLSLVSRDGRRFKLKFNCKSCTMQISQEKSASDLVGTDDSVHDSIDR